MKSVTLVSVLIAFCDSVNLPPNFQKCNRQEPHFNECVLKAAQHGVNQLTKPYEEIGLPNMSPFEVEKATIPGTGKVAVDQNFHNCKLYGYEKMKLDKFEFNFEEKTLEIILLVPELKMSCQYELNGKVLLLPIQGTGPSTIVLKNLKTNCFLKYEELKRKGKTYLKFTSSETALDPELVSFNFENLFNGDAKLGDHINQVLNDNWKEVFDDVKGGYIEIVNQIVLSMLSSFFSRVSLEEALD